MEFKARVRNQCIRAKDILMGAYGDITKNHAMSLAAGLSYYFVLSLFPLLILAASLLGYLPIPNLFDHLLGLMARVVPAESMGMVRHLLTDILRPRRGGLLTFGILGTLWSASSGFASMIEALNVAYDIPETRPWWKTRLLAIGLTFVEGALLVTALSLTIVGPRFGVWLADQVRLGPEFVRLWPLFRWAGSIGFVVLAVELLFFWAPNIKQPFWTTLPGAVVGVGFWIMASQALGWYFRNYAGRYQGTYGKLGAVIALMVWLYWSAFAILAGAEINSELLKRARGGKLVLKQQPPAVVKPRPAREEHPETPAA